MNLLAFLSVCLLPLCTAQNEEVSVDAVVKCMRPSDARLMRPSRGVSEDWFNNQWHTGPYVAIGSDENGQSNAIRFTNAQNAERMWLLEDTMRTRGSYFLMNKNMTKLICAHPNVGIRLSWFDNTEEFRDDELAGCKWMIDIDVNNPANFRIKNTILINTYPEIGYVYFDKTGIYFDYEQRLRNYPVHPFNQSQTWWTWVKSDPEQRDYNEIENSCEIGESGLPTFLENYDSAGVDARGVVSGKRKRKVLKSKDKFVQCAQNWFLFKGKCYRVFKDFRVTYTQGVKVCNFFQTSMFIPRNKKERGFIMKLIRIYDNRPGYYWLGIKADESGTFKDSNGGVVEFRRSARARASFADDSCAIWKKRWYRANCASTHKVICVKEAAQRLTGSCGKIQLSGADDLMELAGRKKKKKDTHDRIVGGDAAEFGQFPWQAGIRFHDPVMSQGVEVTHNCGGSIIDECWVVSAAHCFQGLEKDLFYVRLGDMNNAITDDYEQDFEIDELIIHDNYEAYPAPTRDIALIKLRKKNGKCIIFNEMVQPICLPDDSYIAKAEDRCQVSGWGQTNTKLGQSSASTNLMWATLPLLKDQYCQSRYNSRSELFKKDYMICAGLKEGGTDACTGDSGGPYACRNDAGRYVLTGIVSFGIGCARKKYPGVYTDVREFVPWITTKVHQHGGGNVL